jgi:2-methylcitrate dehydratase PrpD
MELYAAFVWADHVVRAADPVVQAAPDPVSRMTAPIRIGAATMTNNHTFSSPAVAERLAERIAGLDAARLPPALSTVLETLVADIVGLCVAARRGDYITAALAGFDDTGPCTVIGHAKTQSAAAAAFINGVAAHGEDFDDTFEGGPVHAGVVVVPAVLAIAEQEGLSGGRALLGMAVGIEVMCRLSLVKPKAIHKAGFHPTAVLGAMGAAAGVGAALGLNARQLTDSMGLAGSMAGGIIEYLTDGAWTKRMHPGWAAQSGLRAALLGRAGFNGPRTVFEGPHGLLFGFGNSLDGDWSQLLEGFGERWWAETIAFKPYPCGTMTHPYIDCGKRLAATLKSRGIAVGDIDSITCETADGFVHRLWEPLASKRAVPNGYAGKFSVPHCIAAAIVDGDVGLETFTDKAVADPAIRALAGKIGYVIDPASEYPHNYTGHIRAVLANGVVVEDRQPHLRGGAREPLTRADIDAKFALNARYGGWTPAQTAAAIKLAAGLFKGPVDLTGLRG